MKFNWFLAIMVQMVTVPFRSRTVITLTGNDSSNENSFEGKVIMRENDGQFLFTPLGIDLHNIYVGITPSNILLIEIVHNKMTITINGNVRKMIERQLKPVLDN